MEVFNIKFVGEVEKHPVLYDYTLRDYSRKDCTEKAWNEVAKKVNLSAGDCKEKWRNLRSTFAKDLKRRPSGSRGTKRKSYYLAEALQFAAPFIKVAGNPSGKLHDILDHRPSPSTTPEVSHVDNPHEETLLSECISSEPQISIGLSSSYRPPGPIPPPLGEPSASSRDTLSPSPEPSDAGPRSPWDQPFRKKIKNEPSDDDKAGMDYFSANMFSENERREGVQYFLNSLIPDLMRLDDVQLRRYKRRALLLVDEVMGTSPEVLYRPSTES